MSPVLSAEPRPPQPDVPASPVGPALQAIQAELRDIHPGAPLEEAPDPRLAAWGGLLLTVLTLWLAATLARTLWRQRRWARQLVWQGEDLVPRLHAALREAALARSGRTGSMARRSRTRQSAQGFAALTFDGDAAVSPRRG